MQLPAPFGKYELLERIATGGMAEVYLARSFGLAGFEKRLVIKRLRPELADDPRFVQMFINEARIGVHLNHPNVVQVYELGRVGTDHYIAMEHLPGRDLTRLKKVLRARDETIELPLAVEIIAETCRGLAYAHSRTDADGRQLGLVHRDVSPHNILVTFAGEVKLVDFGIARLMNTAEAAEGEKRPGPGGGKYAYMSPEQARGDEVDHRTDIFSAGIVLWELIVGHRLYQSPDPEEKLRRVTEAIVPHPSDEGVDIDDRLWAILSKALAADRDERYDASALFEEDLRAWLFESRHRVGRPEIAALVRRAFPDEADRSSHDLELQQLVADVDRLDPEDRTADIGTPTSGGTPLPGKLRAPVGERRPVVVVIVDVDGLTELSERVEPEMLLKRKYQLLRWARHIVDRYGGIIQSAVDDHITLLFGVPRTRSDDIDHALECALAMHREVGVLRRKGMALDLAVGVHLGEVTVSQVGKRIRYVARGDTTRLARRLSALADHGQTLASEGVLDAVEGRFVLRWGPGVPSRGGRPDLPSYLVERRAHGLRGQHRGQWLRRGPELDVLRDALGELGDGRGAAVALVGPVGCGKSRFIREIRELADRRSIPFYGARCTALGAEPPLEPLRDLVAAVLGHDPETPIDTLVEESRQLSQLGLSPRDVDVLGGLLGADRAHPAEPREIWQAFGRTLARLARERPAIVALDDVHLKRTRFLRALSRLIASLDEESVLFLLSHRGELPEVLSTCTVVRFGPFDVDLQARLVESVLGVSEVGPDVLPLLERTCEGNPLYLEEMLKFLVARGQIVVEDGVARLVRDGDDAELPHSLQALITARIDALDAPSRGLLQLAAVAGATFTEALLAEAAGLDDPAPLLLELVGQGLVVREAGSDEWSFASELVREAALRGTLGVQRRDYHRLIARAVETVHADTLEPWFETLMTHHAEGGNQVQAARYAFRAGMELERSQYYERARRVYQTGLEHLARAGADPDDWDARVQGDAMLHLRLGLVGMLLGDPSEGRNHLAIALDIASEAGLPWIETHAHVALGRGYLQDGRTRLASAHLGTARALLRTEPDPDVEREAIEAQAMLAFEEGRNEEAAELWQQALALAEGDAAAAARCQIGLANRYLRSGDHDRAQELLLEALQTSRQAGDRILEGRVLNNIGLVHSWAGHQEQALTYYRSALELREGIGYTRGMVVNHHNIGDVHFQNGDHAKAWVAFRRSRELAAEIGWERGVALNDVYLAYLDATAGRGGLDELMAVVDQARSIADAEILTSGLWLAGRYLLELGETERAHDLLTEAAREARGYGLQPMVEVIEQLLVDGVPPG